MRKIVVLNRVSLDGFFAGPNGEIDWFIPDPEVDRYVNAPTDQTLAQEHQPGTVLFGRLTYQMMENTWPRMAADPNAPPAMRAIGEEMGRMTKVVFSKTLAQPQWANTHLVRADLVGEVQKLKQAPGPDMLIFGSGTVVQQLANAGLIDEYILIVTPVILGAGKAQFQNVKKTDLKLVDAKRFQSGNVVLHYEVLKQA